MKSHSRFVIIITCFPLYLFAQQPSPTGKNFRVCDVYVQPGFIIQGNAEGSTEDFRRLAPQSALPTVDFSGYSNNNLIRSSLMGTLSVLLGFQFSDKQTTILRLGANYTGGKFLTNAYNQWKSGPYDSLISAQTGQLIILDSTNSKDYTFDYLMEQVSFDASLIFRILPQSRVSLFVGFGLNAGYTFNTRTELNYVDRTRFEYAYSSISYSNPGQRTDEEKHERFRNESKFTFSGYVPMGIDFRLGRKREFFRRIHLCYELRPGISMTPVSDLRTVTNGSIQMSLGLRAMWH